MIWIIKCYHSDYKLDTKRKTQDTFIFIFNKELHILFVHSFIHDNPISFHLFIIMWHVNYHRNLFASIQPNTYGLWNTTILQTFELLKPENHKQITLKKCWTTSVNISLITPNWIYLFRFVHYFSFGLVGVMTLDRIDMRQRILQFSPSFQMAWEREALIAE